MKKHGIIIIHGVGRHEKLGVLTGFAKGFIETAERRAPVEEFTFQANLDAEQKENYAEVSWKKGQEVFQIREAYWQHSFQPHSSWRILRWVWRLVTVLLGLHTKAHFQSAVLVLGLVTDVGAVLFALVLLGWILRWLEGLFSLPAWLVARVSEDVHQIGKWLLEVTFAGFPTWAQLLIGLFVVFSAITIVWLIVKVLGMWRVRGLAQLKTPSAWLAGVRAAGIAIWMGILLLLSKLVRGFPVPFPGKDALADFLGGFSRWVEQDAFGDTEVFASDSLRAASMRRQLEQQIEAFQREKVHEIHIVGHSLGGIISFEVLSRTLQTKWKKRKIRTFFSAGSPIKKFLYLTTEPQPAERVAALLDSGLNKFGRCRALTLWGEPLAKLLEEKGGYSHSHRFMGKIEGFGKGFRWRNIIGKWDLAPDELEKGFEYEPDKKPWGEAVDVPVKSTRRLGAHSAYWDTDSETMRYILEEIAPKIFPDQEIHKKIDDRKKEGISLSEAWSTRY
jgi:hypothetical protein